MKNLWSKEWFRRLTIGMLFALVAWIVYSYVSAYAVPLVVLSAIAYFYPKARELAVILWKQSKSVLKWTGKFAKKSAKIAWTSITQAQTKMSPLFGKLKIICDKEFKNFISGSKKQAGEWKLIEYKWPAVVILISALAMMLVKRPQTPISEWVALWITLLALFVLGLFAFALHKRNQTYKNKTETKNKSSAFTKLWAKVGPYMTRILAYGVVIAVLFFMFHVAKANGVIGEIGTVPIILGVLVLLMVASFLSSDVRGQKEKWLMSYAIIIGAWFLIGTYVGANNNMLGINISEHLRPAGLLALWIGIPACGVAIYLVKNNWVRLIFIIAALSFWGFVRVDFTTSPKTAEVAVLRGAPPSAYVQVYDVSGLRWEWNISYPEFFDQMGRYDRSRLITNDLAIVRDDTKTMSMVEKLSLEELPDGSYRERRYRFYEWLKNERLGNWRECTVQFRDNQMQELDLVDKGRWRAERRDRRIDHFYDMVIAHDRVRVNLQATLTPK